jgi:exodeoxyribonuclease V alpha subunit
VNRLPAAPADGAEEELAGTVERVVFHSDETGYTVCVLRVPGGGEKTVVGTCAAIWAGQELKATGRWTRHKEHGLQFTASRLVCVEPYTAAGIRRYLASGLIKGIGKVLADRLVDKFGDDTLRVIEKESARLRQVGGIGAKRRDQIRQAWRDQKTVQDIMLFLHSNGVSASQAARIHRQYGDDAIALVRANPYRLAEDIWGIGFKTADKIGAALGIPADSLVRAQAGLVHTLQSVSDEGHCFCPRPELLDLAGQLLGIPVERLAEALALEKAAGRVIEEEDRVYHAPLYYAEVGIAARLRDLMREPVPPVSDNPDKALAWAAGRMNLAFDPRQAEALRLALDRKVAIITGGPGVGKTTIIRALVDIASAKRLAVVLAAPTGRAAKRLEEATGRPARTLHRLLKFRPGAEPALKTEEPRVEGDFFILDEVSMMDAVLMNAFLRSVGPRARVVLVGDADQLPSVGPGNVLRDLLDSGAVPAVALTTIFRQADRSWIVHNAHRVNQGQFLELPAASAPSDFYFIECSEPAEVVRRLVALVAERIPRRFGLDPRRDIQVLTPMRRFELGADNLNAALQEALNPGAESVSRYGRVFRRGDRVMQLRNNYDKDVFNGDIGFVADLDPEDQTLAVDFDGRRVAYEWSELDELTPAYACSIHKSQGSEHPAVVIVMTTQHYRLLQRNLLYTAITRGRHLVCLIGSSKAVAIAIRNHQALRRRTTLRERLVASTAS